MSLGPSEERRFEMWVGYEFPDNNLDLQSRGFICVDDWSDDELAARGITTFSHVHLEDRDLLARLGIAELFQENDGSEK